PQIPQILVVASACAAHRAKPLRAPPSLPPLGDAPPATGETAPSGLSMRFGPPQTAPRAWPYSSAWRPAPERGGFARTLGAVLSYCLAFVYFYSSCADGPDFTALRSDPELSPNVRDRLRNLQISRRCPETR